MRTSKFKEQLISNIERDIISKTKQIEKHNIKLSNLKELESKTKILFKDLQKIIKKSKVQNEITLSYYEFSKPSRNLYYIKLDSTFVKNLRTNFKRILKAVKLTNDRNELNILNSIYNSDYLQYDNCYFKLKDIKNIPILFNSKLQTAYITISNMDFQIMEFTIYEHMLLEIDKYGATIFSRLPYKDQVNHLTSIFNSYPNADSKNFKKLLPKDAKIHDFLNKLATFS